MAEWYALSSPEDLDSPALLVYPDRVRENISLLKSYVKSVDQLRPHVKTHKSPEATQLLLEAGIARFKCATIAEAEMLALEGARDILLAYQPLGPKAHRFLELHRHFPEVEFSCLIDDFAAAHELSGIFALKEKVARVWVDLNVGMNRTGIVPERAPALIQEIQRLSGLRLTGVHVYDGHLRDPDMLKRTQQCNEAFDTVTQLVNRLHLGHLPIAAGGSPTFPIHAARGSVQCGPGTFIYWDNGYRQALAEQPFEFAALVFTRIISAPTASTLCTDLGHKSIASENPLEKRVQFLNAPDLVPVGHSEEHLVLKAPEGHTYRVGDVLYGIPYHICPTVALHDLAHTVKDGNLTGNWRMTARRRKLTL
ncbi:MAG: D-TA family PLP-dependent enzyme [Cyclobacteriaceae bacterium]